MCIICNLRDPHSDIGAATDFLTRYAQSQEAMKRATDSLLAVSRLDLTDEDRKRYKAIHKRMVRQMRDWNKLEHDRERQEASS